MESFTIRPLSLTNFNTSRTFSIYKPCGPFFVLFFVNFHKQRPHKIPDSLKIVKKQDPNLHKIHTYKYQRANSQKEDQYSKIFINGIKVNASYIPFSIKRRIYFV